MNLTPNEWYAVFAFIFGAALVGLGLYFFDRTWNAFLNLAGWLLACEVAFYLESEMAKSAEWLATEVGELVGYLHWGSGIIFAGLVVPFLILDAIAAREHRLQWGKRLPRAAGCAGSGAAAGTGAAAGSGTPASTAIQLEALVGVIIMTVAMVYIAIQLCQARMIPPMNPNLQALAIAAKKNDWQAKIRPFQLVIPEQAFRKNEDMKKHFTDLVIARYKAEGGKGDLQVEKISCIVYESRECDVIEMFTVVFEGKIKDAPADDPDSKTRRGATRFEYRESRERTDQWATAMKDLLEAKAIGKTIPMAPSSAPGAAPPAFGKSASSSGLFVPANPF